jgi:lysophospholipid acyltransferase
MLLNQLIFILLTSYPLAHIFIRIPNSQKTLKHLFSIGLTSFYLIGLFRMKWGFVQLVADAMITWGLVVAQVGVKDGKGQGWMPWLVFA